MLRPIIVQTTQNICLFTKLMWCDQKGKIHKGKMEEASYIMSTMRKFSLEREYFLFVNILIKRFIKEFTWKNTKRKI